MKDLPPLSVDLIEGWINEGLKEMSGIYPWIKDYTKVADKSGELITEEYIRRLADEQIEQYYANLRDDSLIYPPLIQYK